MRKQINDSALRNEEQRTAKWYITLFYIIAVSYDIFYYYIQPYLTKGKMGLPSAFSYWIYVIMFGLLPLVIYLNRNKREYLIKYIYFILFISLQFINDAITYYGKGDDFASGNIVEMFFLLFSPIFVNIRFFRTVAFGTLFKYILLAFILKNLNALVPVVIVIILSLISYILLNRFKGYVRAVENSYDQQLEGIVKGVIATLELKDPYTRGHSERVASYAQVLALEMGIFTKEDLKAFNYACLLHDIGKINIPDQILMKPSQLTNEEFLIIQSHPAVGAEAVKDVEGLKDHINVIRSHHERWDGRGYPDRLQGKDIPLLARVVSVADAFDAMTSSRSYRAAMPIEVAYSRIMEGKGTQFDPEIVEVFEKAFPKWTKIHKKYQ